MINQATLKELVHYDPDTGVFTWRKKPGKKIMVGSRLGTTMKNGYRKCSIAGKQYTLHRLAILYVTGEWPPHDVDHINGDRADNRIKNLRCVTRSSNMENQRSARRNNATGHLGVVPVGSKFVSKIQVRGKSHWIGTFETPEEAHEAYLKVKRDLHGGCEI